MSVQMVIELDRAEGARPIVQAIESYKHRLRASIERTRRRLAEFERRYTVTTERFLREMTSEDLAGGDLEYVEWAGEAKLLEGLERELGELEHARYQLPSTHEALRISSIPLSRLVRRLSSASRSAHDHGCADSLQACSG